MIITLVNLISGRYLQMMFMMF